MKESMRPREVDTLFKATPDIPDTLFTSDSRPLSVANKLQKYTVQDHQQRAAKVGIQLTFAETEIDTYECELARPNRICDETRSRT